jgi:hypothetical protein
VKKHRETPDKRKWASRKGQEGKGEGDDDDGRKSKKRTERPECLVILIREDRKGKAKWICHTHGSEDGWYASASHGDGTDHKSPEGA